VIELFTSRPQIDLWQNQVGYEAVYRLPKNRRRSRATSPDKIGVKPTEQSPSQLLGIGRRPVLRNTIATESRVGSERRSLGHPNAGWIHPVAFAERNQPFRLRIEPPLTFRFRRTRPGPPQPMYSVYRSHQRVFHGGFSSQLRGGLRRSYGVGHRLCSAGTTWQ
jgi:hypothetical protein